MLDSSLHKTALISVLKAIYSDPQLRSGLGFKGGTAAFLFYDLPRFSVDLDFDLLDETKKDLVFQKMTAILASMGEITEATEKRFTLFFLLNYQKGGRNLKVEISKRSSPAKYGAKQLLGISVLVMEQADMAAGKLAALLTRAQFASRDVFDLYYFLKNNWPISEASLRLKTGLSLKEALDQAVSKVEKIPPVEMLRGLGELIDLKQRYWVREKLKDEILFQLKLYRQVRTAEMVASSS